MATYLLLCQMLNQQDKSDPLFPGKPEYTLKLKQMKIKQLSYLSRTIFFVETNLSPSSRHGINAIEVDSRS